MNSVEFEHRPVMLCECVSALNVKPKGAYYDGTTGGAGHAGAICSKLCGGVFIGSDRDCEAIAAAKVRLAPYMGKNDITLVDACFNDIDRILEKAGVNQIDGAVLDLGVSSQQLDTAERGFSYMNDAPLDMRMDRRQALSAYEVVNRYSESELVKIFRAYGEERWSARIAEFIVNERRQTPIETTLELVAVIKKAVPKAARQDGIHPAKRVFQAIRIETNSELEHLGQACADIAGRLNKGGRFAIITFHSLEDRIVKHTFKALEDPCPTCPAPLGYPCGCDRQNNYKIVTRKPIIPSEQEIEDNPRARSAKLRVLERMGTR